jgi:hypothetical protein
MALCLMRLSARSPAFVEQPPPQITAPLSACSMTAAPPRRADDRNFDA